MARRRWSWGRRAAERRPTHRLLLLDFLDDAGRMLTLSRTPGVAGGPARVELPKAILEMVRCLSLVRRLDPRHESADRRRVHGALWRELLATETLPPGPALEHQLARLAQSWDDFARVTGDEVRRAGADDPVGPADLDALGGLGADDRVVGTACSGSTHSHPAEVQARLRHHTPCPGLVEAAARAFAPA